MLDPGMVLWHVWPENCPMEGIGLESSFRDKQGGERDVTSLADPDIMMRGKAQRKSWLSVLQSHGELNFESSCNFLLAEDDPWLALDPRSDYAILAAEALGRHTAICSWWVAFANGASLRASTLST